MIRVFAFHPTAANLLMALLFGVGLVSLPTLLRETFPEFTADRVEVRIVYPGASAEDVEEAICRRIEDALDQLTDVEEVACDAREGVGAATIEMAQSGEIGRFLTDVKTEIDAIDSFPDEIETPVVRQLDLTDQVVSIAITGEMAEPDLKVYAEEVKDRLTALPAVSQATVSGFADRQIRIEPNAIALRQYGVSVSDIAAVVERQSIDLPAGLVETREQDVLVRFTDERQTPVDFADLIITASESGAELRLSQLARITDRFELDEARVEFNGRRAALLDVAKTTDQDTLTVMNAVREFLEVERQRAPPGVEFELTRDVASIVQDRLDMLTVNLAQGLVLVAFILWLFFSTRFAFWVVMGLPASFLGTLFVLTLIGYSINMMTMVALLIAIGLLMDDSIVIAENIASHLQRGKRRLDAAVDGTREVAMGVVSSLVTSICVFGPLAFLQGNIGDVLKVVPVVLIVTLAVSFIEAFLILPHHLAHSLDGNRQARWRERFDAGFDWVREKVMGRLIDTAVSCRYLTVGLLLFLFLSAIAMVAGGTLKVIAFPDLDGDVIEARILLPQGTPLERTEAVVAHVTDALMRVDEALSADQPNGDNGEPERLLRNVLVEYNRNIDAFESGPHVATVTGDLLTAERRNGRVDDILNLWREEVGVVPDVLALAFKQPTIGPAGIPIQIRLEGADLDAMTAAADELIAWLGRYRGVADLQQDLRPGKPEIRLRLRPGALVMGLDAAEIAGQLRSALQGRTAAEIQVGSESFEIDVRLAQSDRDTLGDLDYFTVTLPDGSQVPLATVAIVEHGRGVARINRIDGQRTVTVQGDIDVAVANLSEILADTEARFLPGLAERYPGIRVLLEGEAEEQAETTGSMVRGLLYGLMGIYLLLSLQFRSYVEPLIVMLAIPMALIGVVFGHLAMGMPLSMPSIMGFVSLAGIVVNDSILLVLFVKRNARGLELVEAARQASRQRFRPVLLTSLTTIAGLLPLLFERSLQAQVLIPLVTSLAFGLVASTVLVLVMLPCLYAILHDLGLSTTAREEREEATAT